MIWMATGGLQNLSYKKLLPILEREIILIPDQGCADLWRAKIKGFNGFERAKITIVNLTQMFSEACENQGADLGDLLTFHFNRLNLR
jgi:hypothetical protein